MVDNSFLSIRSPSASVSASEMGAAQDAAARSETTVSKAQQAPEDGRTRRARQALEILDDGILEHEQALDDGRVIKSSSRMDEMKGGFKKYPVLVYPVILLVQFLSPASRFCRILDCKLTSNLLLPLGLRCLV